MQNTDDYGRTHTAYVSVREDAAEEETAADKKAEKAARKAAKKASNLEVPVLETADSEIPF
jgi:hypothetical protein